MLCHCCQLMPLLSAESKEIGHHQSSRKTCRKLLLHPQNTEERMKGFWEFTQGSTVLYNHGCRQHNHGCRQQKKSSHSHGGGWSKCHKNTGSQCCTIVFLTCQLLVNSFGTSRNSCQKQGYSIFVFSLLHHPVPPQRLETGRKHLRRSHSIAI
jgi:hypothetical protein